MHKLPPDLRATIASIEFDPETGAVKKLRFWDKNAALDKAMRHLALFDRDNSQRMPNLAIQVNFGRAGAEAG